MLRRDELEARRLSAASCFAASRLAIGRFRQAVLAAACSGRLTEDWRVENSSVESATELIERSRSGIAERGRGHQQPGMAAIPDWLDLPETWAWTPLASLAEIRGGMQKQPKRAPKGNAFPYLRVANVLRGRLELSQIHRFELFDGELEAYRILS